MAYLVRKKESKYNLFHVSFIQMYESDRKQLS